MTEQSERVILTSSADLRYDEKAEAIICRINARRSCWWREHDWVNASLMWSGQNATVSFSIDLKCGGHEGAVGNRPWGMGYGGIRFCRRCKLIDCIHMWESETVYEIPSGPYYSECHVIATCLYCQRRIYRNGWGHAKPDPRALDLINEVARELGREHVGLGSGYGSGWIIELPTYVSVLIAQQGEEAARQYVRRVFEAGTTEHAAQVVLDAAR